jgi:predicted ATP-grasp superfamily ATP-dependent carboligase
MKNFNELIDDFGQKFKRVDAYINKSSFIARQILTDSIWPKPRLSILFSIKPAWEPNIRIGFRPTRHELMFNEFTDENIAKNDLVVPLTMKDLRFMSQHRELLSKNLIPVPTLDAITICDDKFLFYTSLKQNGFEKNLPRIGTHLSYPYILKKKVAEDGDDCYIINNEEQERQHQHLIADLAYFCQEIIAGKQEYATHILFKSGMIKSSINIKYDFKEAFPIKGKNSYISRKICRCPYLDLFTDMLNSIAFEGLCCFNYKVRDNRPYVFEVNPRFGGSLSPFFFSFVSRLN